MFVTLGGFFSTSQKIRISLYKRIDINDYSKYVRQFLVTQVYPSYNL